MENFNFFILFYAAGIGQVTGLLEEEAPYKKVAAFRGDGNLEELWDVIREGDWIPDPSIRRPQSADLVMDVKENQLYLVTNELELEPIEGSLI